METCVVCEDKEIVIKERKGWSSQLSPSGLISGWYFSEVTEVMSSGCRFHTLTPSAAPAAIAAPSAVVSDIEGLTTQEKYSQLGINTCTVWQVQLALEMGDMAKIYIVIYRLADVLLKSNLCLIILFFKGYKIKLLKWTIF